MTDVIFKQGIAYFDFNCSNCKQLQDDIKARRDSVIPIDESKLEFCKHCVRKLI